MYSSGRPSFINCTLGGGRTMKRRRCFDRWCPKKNSVEVKRLPIPIVFNHHFCESMCSFFFCGNGVRRMIEWLPTQTNSFHLHFDLFKSSCFWNYILQKRLILPFIFSKITFTLLIYQPKWQIGIWKWWGFSFDSDCTYSYMEREVILVWEEGFDWERGVQQQKLTFFKLAPPPVFQFQWNVSKVFGFCIQPPALSPPNFLSAVFRSSYLSLSAPWPCPNLNQAKSTKNDLVCY